jgi:hypothetical protein
MGEFVTCGLLKVNEGYSDIVCDPSTGDLIFCDDILGNSVFSNLSISDPVPMDADVLLNIIDQTHADGVIMSGTYLIILNDYTAEYREFAKNMEVAMTTTYDLDTDYEGTIY